MKPVLKHATTSKSVMDSKVPTPSLKVTFNDQVPCGDQPDETFQLPQEVDSDEFVFVEDVQDILKQKHSLRQQLQGTDGESQCNSFKVLKQIKKLKQLINEVAM